MQRTPQSLGFTNSCLSQTCLIALVPKLGGFKILLKDLSPLKANDSFDTSLMYNKFSVGIGPTYSCFIAYRRCQISGHRSCVMSEELQILGKVAGGCILFTQPEWACVAFRMQPRDSLLNASLRHMANTFVVPVKSVPNYNELLHMTDLILLQRLGHRMISNYMQW
jgi:hypothetical protein